MKAKLNIVKKWEKLFNANDISIVETYSPNGILIGTFAIAIKKGRKTILPYFKGLFEKDSLRVDFNEEVFINEMLDGYILSGFYVFSFNENGKRKQIRARYSFVIEMVNGKMLIINHHSSEIPN
jgi:hypothetical protein